jgi:ferredoxin
MIVDLDEYFHPVLSIADAVIGMEGNGPTAGTPRKMGCILASRSPHALDMVAARMIGFDRSELPILEAAYRRGLVPDNVEEIELKGSLEGLTLDDFERVVERRSLEFQSDGGNFLKRAVGKFIAAALRTKPVVKRNMCVGCGVCAGICPAKAITIDKNRKAVIKRRSCIRCFCCQEFCPKSAIKVHRTFIASLFHSKKK